jgi:hypothetical protein
MQFAWIFWTASKEELFYFLSIFKPQSFLELITICGKGISIQAFLNAKLIVSVTFDCDEKYQSFELIQNLNDNLIELLPISVTNTSGCGAIKTLGNFSTTCIITVFAFSISVS